MISVIIPYHNNIGTIREAVQSVLDQIYTDFEILIIANGSGDKEGLSAELPEDSRLRVIWFDESLDASGARNIGVKEAKGEYVAFLDADDYWDREKLTFQMKVMERLGQRDKAPVLCFTARALITDDGKPTGRVIGCNKYVSREMLLRTNQINCSSVMLKREVALANPFPAGRIHEDYALWLTLLKDGGYAIGINKPLLYYRLSHGSRSANKFKSAGMHYRTLRYAGVGLFKSFALMLSYTCQGIKKYYGKDRGNTV